MKSQNQSLNKTSKQINNKYIIRYSDYKNNYSYKINQRVFNKIKRANKK